MANYWKKKLDELEKEKTKSSSTRKADYWQTKMAELEEENERKKNADIAPVRTTTKKEKTPWIDTSYFDDGYDFGDVSRAIFGGATAKDLVSKSIDKGYDQTRLGEEAYKAMHGKKNQMEAYQKLMANNYQFTPRTKIAQGVSGAFELVGQMGRQWTRPDTVAFATTGAGMAALAGQTGPQVLLPEEVITVPTGFGIGLAIGSANAALETEAGNAYLEMLDLGVKDDTAKQIALAVGGVNAALEVLQVDELLDGFKILSKSGASDTLTKRIVKELARRGVSVAKETGQEVAQEGVSILGSQIGSKMDTGEWAYSADEVGGRLLDTATSSALSFGMMNVPGATMNVASNVMNKNNSNVTKETLTENEQKVVEKVAEERIAEAEKDGKKLTGKEKAKIYDEIASKLGKGYISTDTIESVLGGETYKSYQSMVEQEKALKSEIDTLENIPDNSITVKQRERLAEARQQLKALDLKGAKSNLFSEVDKLTANDTMLRESYNERTRKGQAFEADLSKYDAKQRETVKRAIDSGILNNTNRTHEFVDLIAKLSADKGVPFDFTNNQRLKESGFALEGVVVNGFVNENGVTININSAKALNSVVGHEITHVLEGTDLYTELQSAVVEYAKTKNDYQGRYDSLVKLYEDIKDADIDKELTADLVGDYLFTDPEFVKSLSVSHRNVFQKIFDEIKYLYKVATAGSKEARELEKVKKVFEEAYRESGKRQIKDEILVSEVVEETKDLVATHNTTEQLLQEAMGRGVLIMPSLAVTNKSFGDFGDISLLFRKETIDPDSDVSNKLYGADAWTPTQTKLKKNAQFDAAQTAEKLAQIKGSIGEHAGELFNVNKQQFQNAIRKADGSIYNAYSQDIGMQAAYAMQAGIISEIPTTASGNVDMAALKTQLHSELDTDNGWRQYKEWLNAISDSVISSHDMATNEDILNNMRAQPSTAKTFKLSENGELVVPAAEYSSVDELRSNKGRLSENADAETKVVADELISFAKSVDGNFKTVVEAINTAFASRYDVDSIVDSFGDYGINITSKEAAELQGLYRKAVELPTPYFEAKPGREVGFDEVAAFVVPKTIDASLKQQLLDKGYNVVEYDPNVKGDRQRAINNFEDIKFSISDSVAELYRETDTKNPTADGGVKYALANVEDITPSREQRDQNIRDVAEMSSVYSVDASKLVPGEKSIKQIYQDYFTAWGESIHSDVFGDIATKNSSLRSEMRHGSTPVKIASIEAIPSVIQNGKIVEWIEKDSGLFRIVVAAPIDIGGKPYFMGVMLQRDSQNQRLYLHDVVIEEEASDSSQEHLDSTGPSEGHENLYTSSILDKIAEVKRKAKIDSKNPQDSSDLRNSLSPDVPFAPVRGGIYGKDIALAPVRKDISQEKSEPSLLEQGLTAIANEKKKTSTEPKQATLLEQALTAIANKGKTTVQSDTKQHISMEDYANQDSPVFRNVDYNDEATKAAIMQQTHDAMVAEGAVVTVSDSVTSDVEQAFPDLRSMKKKDRNPILKTAMTKLKNDLRQFLNGFKNQNFEFEVNGKVLDATLYNTGINEVLEKVTKDKASMLYSTEGIFQNARYLYSTQDYDGDPNVYRWNYFYTPVQIGDQTVGVRIAVRDLAKQGESQIYNWGIKKNASLGGVRDDLDNRKPYDASSDASEDIIPQSEPVVNTGKDEGESVLGEESVSHDGKQRKWVRTSTDSEAVDGKVLPEDLDQELIHYQPISNKKTLGNANTKLDNMGYDASVSHFKSQLSNNRVSLDDIALGERLVQEAVKKGDTKTAGELIMDISILGTELGQKVQALSIIKRLTPEGQLKMLQKTINRGKTKGDKAFRDIEITQDMIDKILETYGKDGTYDQAELNRVVEDVKQQLADQMSSGVMDYVNEWRYLSMLGNPKTHIRNVVSNIAMLGTRQVKNAMARTIETILPIKERSKTWKRASKDVKAFAKEATAERFAGETGNKYSEGGSIKAKRQIFKTKAGNWLAAANSRALSVEDALFSRTAYRSSLSEYLTANGIETQEDIKKNPDIVARAKQYAYEQAKEATFQQDSYIANRISEIERKSPVWNIAIGSVLPFKKTPINIAKTAVAYSPLGFARNVYDAVQVAKGDMEASKAVDHLAQTLTGTSLTLIGFALASMGVLNGAGDDDKEGTYDYQLGEQSYSLNINGSTISLSWLSPVAMPLFVGANAYEQLVEEKDWNADVVCETLAQTLDPLSEMSFLSSLDDVLSSYDSGVQKFMGIFESAGQSYITQFIPTLSSQVAATFDDTKRSTKASADSGFKFGEETLNQIKYKIPGLRNTLEPTTDIWGNEVNQSDNFLTRAFESAIAPYARREDIATEIDEEIKDLYSQTGDAALIPSIPRNYVSYDGEKYEMSAAEYTDFKKTYGQTAYDLLERLFSTKTYKNADSETRADMVNRVYGYASDLARKEYFAKQGIEFTNATEDSKEVYKEDPIKGAIEADLSVDEYKFSKEYPEKYAVAKSVGGYEAYKAYSGGLNGIKADKDASGKSISGSRKDKVFDYIQNLGVDYYTKIILWKSEYISDDTYNYDIVDYLNSRDDISYTEMVTILKELGFEVSADGRISW